MRGGASLENTKMELKMSLRTKLWEMGKPLGFISTREVWRRGVCVGGTFQGRYREPFF